MLHKYFPSYLTTLLLIVIVILPFWRYTISRTNPASSYDSRLNFLERRVTLLRESFERHQSLGEASSPEARHLYQNRTPEEKIQILHLLLQLSPKKQQTIAKLWQNIPAATERSSYIHWLLTNREVLQKLFSREEYQIYLNMLQFSGEDF